MENYLKAIQKFNYVKPNAVFIQHSRVIELNPEKAAAVAEFNRQKNVGQRGGLLVEERKQEYRTFKCLDCGYIWKENIMGPLVMTAQEVNFYYPQSITCNNLNQ